MSWEQSVEWPECVGGGTGSCGEGLAGVGVGSWCQDDPRGRPGGEGGRGLRGEWPGVVVRRPIPLA